MTKDRWLALPIFASLGIPLALAILWSFVSTTSYSGNILFLFSFFVWLLYFLCGVTALCVGMVFLTKRSWRSASSCSLLPMAVVALTLHEPFWFFICFWVPSYVHFAMLSPYYLYEISSTGWVGEPRMRWFYWRDASGLSGETLVYLVFDESDEFSIPNVQRSDTWKTRASKGLATTTNYEISAKMPDDALHLLGHYYVVDVYD